MCMIDSADSQVRMLFEAKLIARKAHKCRECRRAILPGERYSIERYISEGKFHAHKVCAHCDIVRQWLLDECGGWCYTAIEDDIREHACSGDYRAPVLRLAVGMAWQWRTPRGRLLPVPQVPETTHDLFSRGDRETAS